MRKMTLAGSAVIVTIILAAGATAFAMGGGRDMSVGMKAVWEDTSDNKKRRRNMVPWGISSSRPEFSLLPVNVAGGQVGTLDGYIVGNQLSMSGVIRNIDPLAGTEIEERSVLGAGRDPRISIDGKCVRPRLLFSRCFWDSLHSYRPRIAIDGHNLSAYDRRLSMHCAGCGNGSKRKQEHRRRH